MYDMIDGIDGTGKSTVAKHLFRKFKRCGTNVHLCAEPTDRHYGAKARKRIEEGDYDRPSDLLSDFMMDRRVHHENGLNNFIDRGVARVIQDRGFLTAAAYQTADGRYSPKDIVEMHKKKKWFRFPDRLIIMQCDPKVAIARIAESRGATTSVEKVDFLRGAQKRMLEAVMYCVSLGAVKDIHIIETTNRSLDDVMRNCWAIVQEHKK